MRIKKNFYSYGQSIVEAIVVIGVVVLLATGLIAGTTASLRSTQDGRTRSLAIRYAQEGIEIVRNIRDKNWNTFFVNAGKTMCLGSDGVLVDANGTTCAANIVGVGMSFTRSTTFTWNNPIMVVLTTVSYPINNGQTRSVNLTTYFTQWK